jgi:hypothetical protein
VQESYFFNSPVIAYARQYGQEFMSLSQSFQLSYWENVNMLSTGGVTVDGVWIENRNCCILYELHSSQATVTNRLVLSQSPLLCLVTASNGTRFSAPGLTSYQIPTFLTVISRLCRNGSCSLLYNLCVDRTENTSS